uniref:Uncharacterized protein n=1 Tax=Globisporangium ultimum (strain ATCC 200006 / CBS 805.95 / DAOM BR144) TaxID=431595 RepID=K3WSN1_GLOUD
MLVSSYAQELQALKAELHTTLARLGDVSTSHQHASVSSAGAFVTPREQQHHHHSVVPSNPQHAWTAPSTTHTSSSSVATPSWSVATTRTISTTATPDTYRQLQTVTTASVRVLMHELRDAAQRRRELEMQLVSEMRRENEQLQQQQRDARAPWQSAIEALQRQRAEIIRQIEMESQKDHFANGRSQESDRFIAGKDTEETTQRGRGQQNQKQTQGKRSEEAHLRPGPEHRRLEKHSIVGTSDNQFSIEGVVTLEPLQKRSHPIRSSTHEPQHEPQHHQPQKQQQHRLSMASATQTPLFTHDIFGGRSESHHEILNEVFSIQLKFAEMMLKLEKSVQVRDELLQGRSGIAARYRRGGAQKSSTHRPRAAAHHPVSPDTDNYEDDMSSDNDSFSSGASLGDYAWKLKRYMSDNDDSIQELHPAMPSTAHSWAAPGGSASSPLPDLLHEHRANLSAVEEEGSNDDDNEDEVRHRDPAGSSNTAARTPSTESSDKTTSSSAAKQVRFDDDRGEYATPLIARKFSFDNQSDDDDDFDDSPLSFMGGSSVTSSELNDISLVKAFEAFRRELPFAKKQLFASSTAARALFPSDDDKDGVSKATKDLANPMKSDFTKPQKKADSLGYDSDPIKEATASVQPQEAHEGASNADNAALEKPQTTTAPLSRAELVEKRRQLCLDIQAESAHLVLTFGSQNAHQTERIKQNLIQLRAQLRSVDEQLK